MPVNLLNEKDLNDYLADIVYHGQEMKEFKASDFKSTAFVEQNKDAIVRSMLFQWCKHRLRSHLAEDLPEHSNFLTPIETNEPNLPAWAERCLSEGKPVHRFKADKIPAKLSEDISVICVYLYSEVESYVDETLARAKDTNAKGKEKIAPKLRIDFLKTQASYDTFAKTLKTAQKMHDALEQKAELKKRNEQMYQASLSGTQSIMKLADGMEIVQLTTPEALDYESEYMGHCVGDDNYAFFVERGTTKIYSLRDADGMPHVTFEVEVPYSTGKEKIRQCKGKGNKAPAERYRPYIKKFLEEKDFDIVGDNANIRFIKLYDPETGTSECYDINEIPKGKKFIYKGNLCLSNMGLTELPDLSNVTVEGSFDCSHNKLTSLKGAPQAVGKNFNCAGNALTSLEYAPQIVHGNFNCAGNALTSLEHAPQIVHGNFECDGNHLTSLEHAPQVVDGNFSCTNTRITSLKGAPRVVGGYFDCKANRLTSLEYAPQVVGGDMDCSENQLTSLEHAPQVITGNFDCSKNKLTSFKGGPQEVGGNFRCHENMITSFEYGPLKVGGDYICYCNKLTSFKYAPRRIEKDFHCAGNLITSFRYAPEKIGGTFYCGDNPLTSLEYAPQHAGKYDYSDNLIEKQLNKIARKGKIAEIRYKLKRAEAAKNVSPDKDVVKPKRTGMDKLAARINIMFNSAKQITQK